MTTARELIAQTRLAQPERYFARWGRTFDWEEQTDAKPVKIRGWENHDFFSHRNDPGWRITEGHTGMSVVTRGTLKEARIALEEALDAMGRDAFDEAITKWICRYGLSPRYVWLEEEKQP